MLVSGSAVIVYCLGVFIHWSKFCVSEEVLLLVEQLVVQTTWESGVVMSYRVQ